MISILLASYNGEQYIAEQIESVLRQTEQDFFLYINDDCSTDRTYDIAKGYEKRFPDKVKVTRNDRNSGNAKFNFMKLMAEYKTEYVMLCDQDDVWLPDKIAITLRKMKQTEDKYGRNMPILVHTDLKVVDQDLQVKAESFREYSGLDFNKTNLNHLLVRNIVTGCTVMYNKALADIIRFKDRYIIIHDWYLALIASTFGVIEGCEEQTILYRQHGKNSIGAKNVNTIGYLIDRLKNTESIKKSMKDTYCQAETFYKTYGSRLTIQERKLIKEFYTIPDKSKLFRIITISKYRVFKKGFVKNIGFLIYI